MIEVLSAPEAGLPLTIPDRLRSSLQTLGWSARQFAGLLRVDERTVRRWLSGDFHPPPDILSWLEDLAAYHLARPAPSR